MAKLSRAEIREVLRERAPEYKLLDTESGDVDAPESDSGVADRAALVEKYRRRPAPRGADAFEDEDAAPVADTELEEGSMIVPVSAPTADGRTVRRAVVVDENGEITAQQG